ncbi:MAG: class A beta-lactamase-related serine hydrolase [Ignavibacteria bacterium]|nr:class A beta-lactamase-related serine hydrolase [Ignavibacteria bacterium]
MKKIFSLLFLFLILISCSTTKFNSSTSQKVNEKIYLEKKLAQLSEEYSGTIGVFAKNLKTGEIISINADSLFPTASVIKLPILIAFFTKCKNGELNPFSYTTIKDTSKVGGAGVLQFFEGDINIKLIDAATLMIILSDNTATNAIIDQLGETHDEKLEFVNSTMVQYGLYNTKLLNKVFSYATKKNTPEAKRFGLGYSSPREMSLLLEKIYYNQVIDSFYSNWIISIMKNQQDESMIRKLLPYYELKKDEKIIVANKTGAVDKSRIDVGIVYSPKCDFIISVFADQSNDTRWTHDNKAENAVAKAARMIYDYFNKDK